ncbi:Uncharacterized protein AC504_5203 [Pseudomonas syringae pv. maculicola]|uniref:Uncharacterized protein n=2 Tax=Pseudomonas savastanoi TaxID=29438 RepID=A0A3M3FT42_PSESG|nr:Uncharacterized protein AC515_2436 [Pseudomonas savastanoi pv. phaseolicola]KPB66145.1 Uncharacterized protein AC508_2073 [Pseudomonas amygdali pv. mellea]KPB86930.1 Uncharacterized protein AC504_5203 [Pseudomonas syringae pv. maculicola]RMM58433.1 hypothetical protein ALQ74_01399 [Pseudomonas savastanoi pv. glycinea]KPB37014.1 Uncharacterized protein AC514_0866 [Pseudomonas savastanoi pv. phaseolicola]
MSTETLSEPLVLTPPDNEVMTAARQNILAQVSTLKLNFLSAMKEKMLPLQDALISADKVYRQELANITVQLNTVNLKPIDQKQQLIEADATLSDRQKQQAINLLNGQRIRQVSNITAAVRRSAAAIAEHSADKPDAGKQSFAGNTPATDRQHHPTISHVRKRNGFNR